MIKIIDHKNFLVDIMYRPRCVGVGIGIGNNYIIKGKISNFFLEIDILFWTFGFELRW